MSKKNSASTADQTPSKSQMIPSANSAPTRITAGPGFNTLTFDELQRLLREGRGSEITTNERLVKPIDGDLEGVPFKILDLVFKAGEDGTRYAVVRGITDNDVRFVAAFGSGAYQALESLFPAPEDAPPGYSPPELPLYCKNGLRMSRYVKDGKQAVSYYLAGADDDRPLKKPSKTAA